VKTAPVDSVLYVPDNVRSMSADDWAKMLAGLTDQGKQ
jgi:hypothetical protein